MTITLRPQQQEAFDRMVSFICDPTKQVFVLEGYAGTGKSTLMTHFLAELNNIHKAFTLINASTEAPDYALTATTNKAAESLADITGQGVKTIHSFLGLRLHRDYRTGKSNLVPRLNFDLPENVLIIIDEASFMDWPLIEFVFSRTKNCKIIFIGDPAQLVPIGYSKSPIFEQGYETVKLTDVQRNSGNILQLATNFRQVVETGQWFQFKPDGNDVLHVDRTTFNDMIEAEFTRPDWKFKDSRFLSWTNDRAIEYNRYIRSLVKGDPDFHTGDYGVVNEFVANYTMKASFKTDQVVHIGRVEHHSSCGVDGKLMWLDGVPMFCPNNRRDKARILTEARANSDWYTVNLVDQWVDLRPVFGQTVNKSQGSTYGKVFIDLDDISGVNNGDTMARLLYVGTSRAKEQVVFTGDIS